MTRVDVCRDFSKQWVLIEAVQAYKNEHAELPLKLTPMPLHFRSFNFLLIAFVILLYQSLIYGKILLTKTI